MSNKYLRIYNALIHKRTCIEVLKKSKEHYGEYENHHIIPKACNGSNIKQNIVCLTIREHYIAHLLLAFIYKGTEYETAMLHAISYMKIGSQKSKRSKILKFNSHLYAQLVSKGRKRQHRSYKGYVQITNGINNKFIHPSKLEKYLINGWKRGQTQKLSIEGRKARGAKYKNTYFVTNGIDNLRIANDQPIPAGYHKGRVFNCSHLSNNPTSKNHKWMHKDNVLIHVLPNQIETYIQLGFQLGFGSNNNNFKFSAKGKICINNGINNKMVFPSELEKWTTLGWIKGQLKQSKQKKINIFNKK